jgi:predicted RNA-binding protein YlqC (UPF0109 family)
MDIAILCRLIHEKVLVNILHEMLDSPGEAKIEYVFSERTISFSIETNDSDRGKLIGLRGRNIDAIRTICNAICARHRYKFHLTIVGAARDF